MNTEGYFRKGTHLTEPILKPATGHDPEPVPPTHQWSEISQEDFRNLIK